MKRGRIDEEGLLIQRICIAFRGDLNPRAVQIRRRVRPATLVESWKVMKF